VQSAEESRDFLGAVRGGYPIDCATRGKYGGAGGESSVAGDEVIEAGNMD
jgi:hypothetical protein